MIHNLTLKPITQVAHLAEHPLAWSIKLWGEGKEEFSAQDWQDFYKRSLHSNYEIWDFNGFDQDLLYLAVTENNDEDEVVASIALCDFDDFEELRKYRPWIAAFIVKEELRGSGIGGQVLSLMEQKIKEFGIDQIFLWTEGEKAFYEKRGYGEVEQLRKPGRIIDVLTKNLR